MSPSSVILSVLLAIYAIKEGYELFKWWKNRVDDYHGRQSEKEDFHNQVHEIACISGKHTETLEKISVSLDKINERLDNAETQRKADMVANGRATLYRLYEVLKNKPSLSPSEYETFNEIANRYLDADGNGVFRNKIIPMITGKPVMEDEG